MKSFVLYPIILVAGLGVGGGAAYAVHILIPGEPGKPAAEPAPVDTTFTPAGKVLAPLVFVDGRLSGYVTFEVQLETTSADVAFITPRLPLLLNAINMRTFRAPMASGPDGMLPNLSVFQKLVLDASNEAFGRNIVRRVVITQASPA